MANKSTDMDKEMVKLLEHFAQEYHKIVIKETVTLVMLCAGGIGSGIFYR